MGSDKALLFKNQGPLNGGGFKQGVSRSGLVLPFLSFPDFSGIFPICSGMVRGFSRLVPFLFLGLLRAPTRNSPERVRDTIWTFPEKSGKPPGLETPRFSFSQRGQMFMYYLKNSEPNEQKSFRSGTRPGGSVTGPTRQSFMCKSFCALFGYDPPWRVPKISGFLKPRFWGTCALHPGFLSFSASPWFWRNLLIQQSTPCLCQRDCNHYKIQQMAFSSGKSLDFPPGGCWNFQGTLWFSQWQCRFLHPSTGEQYRRILYRSVRVGVKASPLVAVWKVSVVFVTSKHTFRVAGLQNEVGTKYFFSRHEFSHWKCSEIFPKF